MYKYEEMESISTKNVDERVPESEKKANNCLRDLSVQTTKNLTTIASSINTIRNILGCYTFDFTEMKIDNFVDQIEANERLSEEILKAVDEINRFLAG